MRMVEEKTWNEFRQAGLLWWINMILHTFGWAIVIEIEKEEIVRVYPARVKYRGFGEKQNKEGYTKVSEYIKAESENLAAESRDEMPVSWDFDFNRVKNALEKQAAKKPDYEGDAVDEDGDIIYDTWICPNCEKRYEIEYDDYKFCPGCGQKIDWNSED